MRRAKKLLAAADPELSIFFKKLVEILESKPDKKDKACLYDISKSSITQYGGLFKIIWVESNGEEMLYLKTKNKKQSTTRASSVLVVPLNIESPLHTTFLHLVDILKTKPNMTCKLSPLLIELLIVLGRKKSGIKKKVIEKYGRPYGLFWINVSDSIELRLDNNSTTLDDNAEASSTLSSLPCNDNTLGNAHKPIMTVQSASRSRTEPAANDTLTFQQLHLASLKADGDDDDDDDSQIEGMDSSSSDSEDSSEGSLLVTADNDNDNDNEKNDESTKKLTDLIYNHKRLFSELEPTALTGAIIDQDKYMSLYHSFDGGYFGRCNTPTSTIVPDTTPKSMADEHASSDRLLYLTVSNPFCLVCVGVQGAGKSHTMNVVLENCMLNCPVPQNLPITRLRQSMCGLVLHYDQSESNTCEAIGLKAFAPHVLNRLPRDPPVSPLTRLVVLVSPSFYHQRKRFYDNSGIEVRPLLFSWKHLGAQQLKKIMRLNENDAQLYVSGMLDLLRSYQRSETVPIFSDFLQEVQSNFKSVGQISPLRQRLQLLKSFVKESETNRALFEHQVDLGDLMGRGILIVCDLTDPMLSADEANGIFQVLLEQFRNKTLSNHCGKVVAFDEAHKYLSASGGGSSGSGKGELSAAIVDTVRLMRHEGIRVLISTQSPLALPSELLELVTVTVLHHFQSTDWIEFLQSKIPVDADTVERVKSLETGAAVVVSTKFDLAWLDELANGTASKRTTCVGVVVRPRLTTDYGVSRRHK